MLNITTRWAGKADLEALFRLEARCFGKEARGRNDLRQILHSPHDLGIVAEVAGRIVGVLFYFLDLEAKEVYLHGVAVLPEYQRQGIGTRLVQKCVQRFDAWQLYASTHIAEEDLRSQLFLKTQGFRCSGIIQPPNNPATYVFERLPAGSATFVHMH